MRALQQQQLEDLVGLLHRVQPFAGLTREQLTSLAIFVRPLEVPKDQVVVKQGDTVDAFYLIKSGVNCRCNTGFASTFLGNSTAVTTGQPGMTLGFSSIAAERHSLFFASLHRPDLMR